MIAKIHHDTVKDKIIWVAYSEGLLDYVGKCIGIFPDLTAEVIWERKEFDTVWQKLRETGI